MHQTEGLESKIKVLNNFILGVHSSIPVIPIRLVWDTSQNDPPHGFGLKQMTVGIQYLNLDISY